MKINEGKKRNKIRLKREGMNEKSNKEGRKEIRNKRKVKTKGGFKEIGKIIGKGIKSGTTDRSPKTPRPPLIIWEVKQEVTPSLRPVLPALSPADSDSGLNQPEQQRFTHN